MRYHVCKKREVSGDVLRDDEVTLITKSSKADYPQRMRRIVALVEVDGKWSRWSSSPTIWTGLPPASATYTIAAGPSRFSSSRSNRASKSATSSGIPNKPFAGSSGRLCWCICYCVSKRGVRIDLTASHASSPRLDPCSGIGST